MRECLKLFLAVALLALVAANFGVDVVYILGSPRINYHRADEGADQRDNTKNTTPKQVKGMAALVEGALQKQSGADATTPDNPNINQDGPNIWVILQGLSAPFVAVFTLILMCVGSGQLWAIRRQGDIAEKALVSAEQAFVFVDMVNPVAGVQAGASPYYDFVPRWTNCGTTPARRALFHTSVYEGDLPDGFNYPDHLEQGEAMEINPTTIGPHVSVGGNPRKIAFTDLSRAFRGETKFFLYGWTEYDDIFPDTPRHRTEFCVEVRMRIDPSTVRGDYNPFVFQNYGPHNGSEDECYRKPTSYVRRPHDPPATGAKP